MEGQPGNHGPTQTPWALCGLVGLGLISTWIYVFITALSQQFIYGQDHQQRPLILVLVLFGVNFVLYLVALAVALRARSDGRLTCLIVGIAVMLRATLLFSNPIQEIDIYRYIWDGSACAVGVNPYQYSPAQVLAAPSGLEQPAELAQLVHVRDHSPSRHLLLNRVHFSHVPSVYPPVSQAAFAAAAWWIPYDASPAAHIIGMKLVFLLFDVATIGVVLGLLRLAGKHAGWCLAYAWCPLTLKEVANSGHLDSLAVFLTATACLLAVWAFYGTSLRFRTLLASLAGVFLALGVGAKFFPVVVAPLILGSAFRQLGWKGVWPFLCFVSVAIFCLLPIFPARTADSSERPKTESPYVAQQDPSSGLRVFLTRWEMNDFLFQIVAQNFSSSGEHAWFTVTPKSWRDQWTQFSQTNLGTPPELAGFLMARVITTILFGVLLVYFTYHGLGTADPGHWLEQVFLIIAWFWLLSPTQNPWYWLWALPFVAFTRNRVWLMIGGLVFLYYVRFWLIYHWHNSTVLFDLGPAAFFQNVVIPLEFGPFLFVLFLHAIFQRTKK